MNDVIEIGCFGNYKIEIGFEMEDTSLQRDRECIELIYLFWTSSIVC
jgi:hypothetical protein